MPHSIEFVNSQCETRSDAAILSVEFTRESDKTIIYCDAPGFAVNFISTGSIHFGTGLYPVFLYNGFHFFTSFPGV